MTDPPKAVASDAVGDGATRLARDLPPEAFRRVADARRDIWSAGFKGLAVGAATGLVVYGCARAARLPFAVTNPNSGPALVFGGFALGGFLGSSSMARTSFDRIGDVFHTNSKPVLTPYQISRQASASPSSSTMSPPASSGAAPPAVASRSPPPLPPAYDHHLTDYFAKPADTPPPTPTP